MHTSTQWRCTQCQGELVMVSLAFNLSIQETEERRSLLLWGQPGLHSEFQAIQGYIVRLCLKRRRGGGDIIKAKALVNPLDSLSTTNNNSGRFYTLSGPGIIGIHVSENQKNKKRGSWHPKDIQTLREHPQGPSDDHPWKSGSWKHLKPGAILL